MTVAENASTRSVAAIAKTPSLNASSRAGLVTRSSPSDVRERRRELASDQTHRLEVAVEEVLEHHAVAAGALVLAKLRGDLVERADHGSFLEPLLLVVERDLARPHA